MVSCEAGVEDVRNRGEEAQKDPAEEEAARRRAYEEAVTRAVQEIKSEAHRLFTGGASTRRSIEASSIGRSSKAMN